MRKKRKKSIGANSQNQAKTKNLESPPFDYFDLPYEKVSPKIVEEVIKQRISGKAARRALDIFVSGGCDAIAVLVSVRNYCGIETKENRKKSAEKLRKIRQSVIALSDGLSEYPNRITSLNLDLARLGEPFKPTQGRDVPAALREYLKFLNLLRLVLKRVSTRKTGEDLLYLSHLCRLTTGKPRYKEIADLVEGVQRKEGQPALNSIKSAEDIKKIVERARKKDPLIDQLLAELAKADLAEWKR